MTLPSNASMHVFPDNTLTSYNTLLPEYVTNPTPMECALQEITCPTTWYNVLPETILVIEGETITRGNTRRIKRLQHVLGKRSHEFFPTTQRAQEIVMNRQSAERQMPDVDKCLSRGVIITRTQEVPTTPPTTTTTPPVPVAPSDVSNSNQDTSTEEKEARERSSVSAAVAAVNRHARGTEDSMSAAVASVSSTMSMPPVPTEVGAYISLNGLTEGVDQEVLRSVKEVLNIKGLDKLFTTFFFRNRRTYKAFSVEGVYLKDNADLVGYLNTVFSKMNPIIIRKLRAHFKNTNAVVFSYNRYTMKCTISLPPNIIMQLPVNLGLQLGFGGGTFITEKTEGRHVVDLKFRAQTVYVYSDIVKHSIVGDKRAPLLRIVNVNPLLGDTQTVAFQPLIYQPVSKTSFKEIGIYLRDGTGRPIPFERGAVNVVLAFRPVSSRQ